jgi:hypothetical protein
MDILEMVLDGEQADGEGIEGTQIEKRVDLTNLTYETDKFF